MCFLCTLSSVETISRLNNENAHGNVTVAGDGTPPRGTRGHASFEFCCSEGPGLASNSALLLLHTNILGWVSYYDSLLCLLTFVHLRITHT